MYTIVEATSPTSAAPPSWRLAMMRSAFGFSGITMLMGPFLVLVSVFFFSLSKIAASDSNKEDRDQGGVCIQAFGDGRSEGGDSPCSFRDLLFDQRDASICVVFSLRCFG